MESNPEAASVFRLSEEYTRLPTVRRGSVNRNMWSDDNNDVEMTALGSHRRRPSRSPSHSFRRNDMVHLQGGETVVQAGLNDIGEEARSSLDELMEGEVLNPTW
jgi:hypothetical protein